jgi:hypothetical protein
MNNIDFTSGVGGSATRQTVDLGVDWSAGDWDFSLLLQHFFGDDEEATSIGLYGQVRF